MQQVYENILETVGRTPMVRINRLHKPGKVQILAKLEGQNPSGSIKDRIAIKMIERAEQEGRLRPGMTILEPTSGNTGIGLAMVGAVKGYPVEIVMSEGVSVERRKIIEAYGGKIHLTPANEGTDGAIRRARALRDANPDKYFMPDQFSNIGNYMAHYENTAIEIWEQTGGKIDYLVSALGTSGTIMGLTKFLKRMNPNMRTICAHPVKGHYIQGLKNMDEAIVPAIYDPSLIDVQEMIESDEAIQTARRIISREGIFAGMSSGAAMLAALRTAEKVEAELAAKEANDNNNDNNDDNNDDDNDTNDKNNKEIGEGCKPAAEPVNIVVILPDKGDKYLSTAMFTPKYDG